MNLQTSPLQATGAAPLIGVHGKWRTIPGCLHGVRFPSVIGEVAIGDMAAGTVGRIARGLEKIVPGLGLPSGQSDDAAGLARLLAEAGMAILDYHVHPVIPDVWSGRGSGPGIWRVAFPYHSARAALVAAGWLIEAFNALATGDERAAGSRLPELVGALRRYSVEPTNTQQTVRAAHRLNIPVTRIAASIFRLGHGRHARLVDSSLTDLTSSIGVRLARDKQYTATILNDAGLPGPVHFWVATPEAAVEAARRLGWPVVIKPADKDKGAGVITGLGNEEDLVAAFAEASRVSERLLVEKQFDGQDHRITVIAGAVLKIELRIPGGVTGDGAASIAELVAQRQARPHDMMVFRRRGSFQLTLDEDAGPAGIDPRQRACRRTAGDPASAGQHFDRCRHRADTVRGNAPR